MQAASFLRHAGLFYDPSCHGIVRDISDVGMATRRVFVWDTLCETLSHNEVYTLQVSKPIYADLLLDVMPIEFTVNIDRRGIR
jgi:hypothetical protein